MEILLSLFWNREEKDMWILVVPTNCSKQWKDQPSDSLVRWRIVMTPSLILPCYAGFEFPIDLIGQTLKSDIEEHDAKYILIKSLFPSVWRGRYWIVGLFWKLHFHFTPLENLQGKKKKNWRERRGLCELLRDDCWISRWQVLYKMPVPQGDNKLKQTCIIKAGKTCRRTSSLHCTFLRKCKIVVSQSPVSGI